MSNFLESHKKSSNLFKSQTLDRLCKVQAPNEGAVSRLGNKALQISCTIKKSFPAVGVPDFLTVRLFSFGGHF